MTTINTTNTAAASPPAASSTSAALAGSMSQADFLQLMTAQLQAQDPTNPVDNSQFVSQMAQFSQLSATQDLLTSVNGLSSNVSSALQSSQMVSSSNLINQQVMAPSSTINYTGSPVNGAVDVGTATNATVNILDASGNIVSTGTLSGQNGGLSQFSWDGTDSNGNPLAAGTYTISASSNGSALNTYVAGTVTSVGYGGTTAGTYLQVSGVGNVPLSQVAQVL